MEFLVEWILAPLIWILIAFLFHFSIIGWIIGLVVSFIFKEFLAPILVTLINAGIAITYNTVQNQNRNIPNDSYYQHDKLNDEKKSEDSFQEGFEKYNYSKHDEAIYFFTKAINMNDKNYKYYFYRGHAYFIKQEFNSAKNDFNIAIRLNSNCSEAYFYRGCCWLCLRQIDIGKEDFQTAIKLGNKDAIKFWSSHYEN